MVSFASLRKNKLTRFESALCQINCESIYACIVPKLNSDEINRKIYRDSPALKATGSCISSKAIYLAVKAGFDNFNEEKRENK